MSKVMGMMATQDFSKYAADLSKLHDLLTKAGVDHGYRVHPIVEAEPDTKKIIGYHPAGEYQIIIPDKLDWDISIIRGMVSWGYYEAWFKKETYRFETPEEVVSWIKENYEENKA
jgi:hypothetical protein